MKNTIRGVFGTIAGIFIMLALFQALAALPEFNRVMGPIFEGIVNGLIIGAVIAAAIGIGFLYVSIKGR